jgi:exodeoxyribonuclease VII small subunit
MLIYAPFLGSIYIFDLTFLGHLVPKKTNSINFEKTLAELEQLVEKMEEGDLSLEESLKYFERGILLTKSCQQALSEAEQKVSILLEKDGKSKLESFNSDDNNE